MLIKTNTGNSQANTSQQAGLVESEQRGAYHYKVQATAPPFALDRYRPSNRSVGRRLNAKA